MAQVIKMRSFSLAIVILLTVIFSKTAEAAPTLGNNFNNSDNKSNNFIPRSSINKGDNNNITSESVLSSVEGRSDHFVRNSDSDSSGIPKNFQGLTIVGGTEEETLEYEPSIILRCKAFGRTKPNVSWEYNGKPLHNDFIISENEEKPEGYEENIINKPRNIINNHSQDDYLPFTNNNNYNNDDNSPNDDNKLLRTSNNRNSISLNNSDLKTEDNYNKNYTNAINNLPNGNQVSWIDFKLPKLNLAFYGHFICKAVNEDGVATKSYLIIANANSSIFMRIVRTAVALSIIGASGAFLHFCNRYREHKKLQKYEKLPTQDLYVIRKFQNGIPEPTNKSECTTTLTIPICTSRNATNSLDVSTTSINSLRDANTGIEINSWANYMAFDDHKDLIKEFFKIDFENTLQLTESGVFYEGKIRCPRTLKWKPVAVKTGRSERDDLTVLEGLLAELKVLITLTEECPFIVNLQATFTKKLYKKQVYMFVDLCKYGTLDKYIDLNQSHFLDLFAKSNNALKNSGIDTDAISSSRKVSISDSITEDKNDENGNSSPNAVSPLWSFSTEELVVWSAEIADGMRFLHKNKILHGNLGVENIFLTDELVAKIGNIGHPVKKPDQENTRRLPPEYRLCNEYTKRSDVWSYGMILWDIYSLRQFQSPSDSDISDLFAVGNPLLPSPKHSNSDIEEQMQFCWNPDPNLRPDFGHLSNNFRRILSLIKP